MSQINKDKIINILDQIIIPGINVSIIKANVISAIILKENNIGFSIKINKTTIGHIDYLIRQCHLKLKILSPNKITIVSTEEKGEEKNIFSSKNSKYKSDQIKKIIVIASGKGGVGKSTIAASLAIQASKEFKIGLLDIDINGPSIAHIFNLKNKPIVRNNKLTPLVNNDIKLLSMGSMIDQDSAIIWRSPMYSKILKQMIIDCEWGELDYLLIDSPPGTGEIHLSLAENYEISGVILVSIPHDLSIIDTNKSIDMYRKLNIPIIGIIENLSYLVTISGEKHQIFEENKVKKFAEEKKLNFLAKIPYMQFINNLDYISQIPKEYEEILRNIIKHLKILA